MKILAYITAFCDEVALHRCIQAICAQSMSVNEILIVDNSPSPLAQDIQGIPYFQKPVMTTLHHPENIGVGGGVSIALKTAMDENYDFLWLLDQDSLPNHDCLEELIHAFLAISQESSKSLGIVAPSIFDVVMQKSIGCASFDHYRFKEVIPEWDQLSFVECDAPIISGSLVSVAAARRTDLPKAGLFIDGVDLDYGLKIRKQGFNNIVISQAILHHHLGTPMAVIFKGVQHLIHNYSAMRTYYYYRNHTYLELSYAPSIYKPLALMHRTKVMLKELALTMLYRDHKIRRMYACCLGTLHGLQGKLGKADSLFQGQGDNEAKV